MKRIGAVVLTALAALAVAATPAQVQASGLRPHPRCPSPLTAVDSGADGSAQLLERSCGEQSRGVGSVPDDMAGVTRVALRRGPCLGRCATYSVSLSADGSARWTGRRFVDRLGPHEGRVPVEDFNRLARLIRRVGFLQWDPEYIGGATDLPDYFLTVHVGQRSHTVRQNGVDEPVDFRLIAALVDRAAERVRWTPADGGLCRGWTAVRDGARPGPALLTVRGTCTFPTGGLAVQLRRHAPQGINPRDLLLNRVVHPPTGPVTQAFTDVQVRYTEEVQSDYDTVTVLPEGPTIPVQTAREDGLRRGVGQFAAAKSRPGRPALPEDETAPVHG